MSTGASISATELAEIRRLEERRGQWWCDGCDLPQKGCCTCSKCGGDTGIHVSGANKEQVLALITEIERLKIRAECPYEAGCPAHGPQEQP